MLYLVKNSLGIITDSGGLQKDAFWLKKPTITLRENTEWVETLKFNQNILINEFPSNLLEEISSIKIKNFDRYKDFGNGNAVKLTMDKIKEILIKYDQ